ncbi:hypothetical protein C7T94_09290 [Pedobacter yulinensis]|uniref:Uncharacterized protein n=1 Tax=Pedobacter yulinensis TaxID=2126353 RepID=A0A2T3HK69_9SPHI|nr:hypothetical protein C7T94_09290 [Pedobacter yulinensis]
MSLFNQYHFSWADAPLTIKGEWLEALSAANIVKQLRLTARNGQMVFVLICLLQALSCVHIACAQQTAVV